MVCAVAKTRSRRHKLAPEWGARGRGDYHGAHNVARLKAGVAGAGVFGGYHASKYAAHAQAALVGVFDPDQARAQALASHHGVRVFERFEDLLGAVDVVTIASPALYHGALARAALEAGRHVLIEKPIAVTLEDADAITALAKKHRLAVQVGHQERFVFAAMGLLDIAERPRTIAAHRRNRYSPRGTDVSVTLDLMTHDLDLARLLAGRSPVAQLTGETETSRSAAPDRALASIVFANGTEARLEASRLAEETARGMRIEYASGVVEVDFIAKSFVNTTPHALNADFRDDPKAKDSLGAGVDAFLAAARGEAAPAVSGEDGRAALALALAIDAQGAMRPQGEPHAAR